MEKVVYILGAGFSAPLGLPVISNFLERAKNMYFSDTEKYKYFKDIFDKIKNMAAVKNYYDSDQTNIEELFSLLEMERVIGKINMNISFDQFICDVIKYYTPPINAKGTFNANWQDQIFSSSEIWPHYAFWTLSLFNCEAHIKEFTPQKNTLRFTNGIDPQIKYSIVTLNYDLVLENICSYVNESFEIDNLDISFDKSNLSINSKPCLSKLHGSAEDGKIIPPTWNKGLRQTHLLDSWELAYSSLSEANYIRILGYSLPEGDSYIKYLLKSAVLNSEHLKKIDIVCLDPDNEVRKRYDSFISSKQKSFFNQKIEVYLNYIKEECKKEKGMDYYKPLKFNKLEQGHKKFVETYQYNK